jgi:hypothetical protein
MYIDFTSKQYFFILHALAVMITFYNNDFSSICKEVGEAYGASKEDIASACTTLTAINVTAPVESYSDKCSEILEDMLHHARELPEKDAPYKYSIGLNTPSWKVVADALDTYSRILMGQFGIIFESLDIAANYDYGKLRLLRLQAYHDVRWNGVGVIEARDLLIPQLKKIGVGWNGNFGISNSELAYNSKLTYEILKTIRYAVEKRDSSVLKVTDEPLPRVEGTSQIRAL